MKLELWAKNNLFRFVCYCTLRLTESSLQSQPLQSVSGHGKNYIDSPNRFLQLKKDFSLNPKFILFWDHLPDWLENFYLPPNAPCPHTNCYYTDRKTMFDPTLFEAIVFMYGVNITDGNTPKERLSHQKYIYFSLESSQNFPKTDPIYDNFFNWTWTYKFGSTEHWPYFFIFDKEGNIVGPKTHMKWIENMDPINETYANKLTSKKRAAVWVVSKCKTKGYRGSYVRALSISMKLVGLKLDVYGNCSKTKRYCDSLRNGKCSSAISRDYYFYLSFENSIADDYVTEKLMHALINDAVPIVYGGAHYSRFLPRGSYLNARKYTPFELAVKMKKIIENRTTYNDLFRWRNHYVYRSATDLAEVPCRFCSAVNNAARMNQITTIANFTKWWNT